MYSGRTNQMKRTTLGGDAKEEVLEPASGSQTQLRYIHIPKNKSTLRKVVQVQHLIVKVVCGGSGDRGRPVNGTGHHRAQAAQTDPHTLQRRIGFGLVWLG